MRRIGRWMLNALTVLSLLLCVVLILWRLLGLPLWIGIRGQVTIQFPAESEWQGFLPAERSYKIPVGALIGSPWALQYDLAIVITLILPLVWAALWRARRRAEACRAAAGRCANCSYDLTGNVSGVCPECGMKIAEAK